MRAVVWDLDGVIVDSGDAHNVSWNLMATEFGVPYDPHSDFKGIFGRHNTDIISSLWQVNDPDEIERMASRKEILFREAARKLKPLPGVMDLVRSLQEAGWKQGIGSSAPLENIRLLLDVCGLTGYMQAIASGEDVARGKPDPQVFLLAFQRLGVSPRDGVVIEDAPAGVQAARAAGAAGVGVTNTQTEKTLWDAGADLVVPTLEGLGVSVLEDLVRWNQARIDKREA
jgi:beta-phosphoglucomutase